MSGFAGLIRLGSGEAATAEDARCIEDMAQAVEFRGPDAQSIWSHPDVHFCFSFLKKGPAPQSSTQPCSLDGRTWLLGDVRLDGREELLRRFEKRGERIEPGISDEELVLHVFQIFGENAIAALDGDFSFILWDTRKKRLAGFRDLTGSKPFFYLATENVFAFSNTLNALRFSPSFDGRLDETFLGDYLAATWCRDLERTVYQQVRRLPPGHTVGFSADGLQIRRVSQFPIEEMLLYRNKEEYVEHYRELLHAAVKERLPEKPSVVFMSGGLDSTTVAAEANRTWAKRFCGGSIRALTIDYQPLFDDHEGAEAQRVANHLGIFIEILNGGGFEPFASWNNLALSMPEPQNEPFFALQVEKHRRAAAEARVALSGDGGDDVLLGQAWPYLRNLLKRARYFKAAGSVLGHVWNKRSLPVLGLGIRSGIQNRIGRQDSRETFPEWILPEFEKRLSLRERFEGLQKRPTSEHPTHPWPYSMLSGPFWPSVLESEDAARSGVPLEARAPLLDRRMVRYLLRLPVMPWCMDKHLVRQAMKGALPPETLKRQKMPLLKDPLLVWVRQKNWNPLLLLDTVNVNLLDEMVDRRKLESALRASNGGAIYQNLTPLTLGLWLKSVEMSRRIQ